MIDLTPSEVCQVLNLLAMEAVDSPVYCLDERGVDEGQIAFILVAVPAQKREGLYRIAESLSFDEAVKRISVLLSMDVEGEDAG